MKDTKHQLDINVLKYYLGTGVKVIDTIDNNTGKLVGFDVNRVLYWYGENNVHLSCMIDNCKLCLRPMSDITKEIEHNGERFVPLDLIQIEYGVKLEFDIDCGVWYPTYNGRSENIFMAIFPIISLLINWKFNVFNLDPSLWVDINTIE